MESPTFNTPSRRRSSRLLFEYRLTPFGQLSFWRHVTIDSGNGFTGLVDQVSGTANLVNEALSIAYHNAVIILDSSGDSAHRAFGCLYGVERYVGNPAAFVPRSVAIASGIQKLVSAIFIFLFLLAVRNMLGVK